MQNYWITTHSDCEELEQKSSQPNSIIISDDVTRNDTLANCNELCLTEIIKYGPGCGYSTGIDHYIHHIIRSTSGGMDAKGFHHNNRFCVLMPAIVSEKS